MPESLLETELFGSRKTWLSATQDEHPGIFRENNGGTVLLNDIDALPIALQDRLLVLLEHGRIELGGDVKPVELDIRILTATRESIPAKVAGGEFRRDLAERIGVVEVVLPPLCERADDIPLFIGHFLAGKIHSRTGQPFEISREAIEACRTHSWPGNVRELEGALNHACILCQDGVIQVSDLPHAVQQRSKPVAAQGNAGRRPVGQTIRTGAPVSNGFHVAASGGTSSSELVDEMDALLPLKRFMHEQEVLYLQRTLARCAGNKERAAEILGISLATMYRKLSESTAEPVLS